MSLCVQYEVSVIRLLHSNLSALFDCLCNLDILTYVTIISLYLHKPYNAHLPALKEALKERGLDIQGNAKALQARLLEYEKDR